MSPISAGQSALACLRAALIVVMAGVVAACAPPLRREPAAPTIPASRPGAYYQDDGPGTNPPDNLEAIPDAMPRLEPLHRFANRPYTVFGHDYVPATSLRSYRERGLASWYGRKFHAQNTAIGEPYDMYAMTAAHPTLPLPSYARVTNLANGKSVVVRVNDRGPFHPGRIIDLSYAAAYRLGIAQKGSGEVEVESILPGAAPVQLAGPLPPVAASETPPALALPIGQEAGGYVDSARRVRQLCECAGICRPAGEPNRESRRRTKSPAGLWAISSLRRTVFDQGGGSPGCRPAARSIGARLDGPHRTAGAVTR